MIIIPYRLNPKLIRGFPVRTIITNIVQIQLGKPATAFYGTGRTSNRMVEIEAGPDEAAASFRCAIACTEALLTNLSLVSTKGSLKQSRHTYKNYKVVASVIFPNNKNYKLKKDFNGFEPIKKHQALAYHNKTPIQAPFSGHVLFGKKINDQITPGEEVFFLTRKPKIIRL